MKDLTSQGSEQAQCEFLPQGHATTVLYDGLHITGQGSKAFSNHEVFTDHASPAQIDASYTSQCSGLTQ
eukprot:1238002-Karenia_brevis.AAC.1